VPLLSKKCRAGAGIAGAVSRTATAPVDRVKLLLQVQDVGPALTIRDGFHRMAAEGARFPLPIRPSASAGSAVSSRCTGQQPRWCGTLRTPWAHVSAWHWYAQASECPGLLEHPLPRSGRRSGVWAPVGVCKRCVIVGQARGCASSQWPRVCFRAAQSPCPGPGSV